MGQKYASYDASGIVNGYYDSIDSPLPPGVKAIPITDAEWQEAISSPYQPVTVVNGVLNIPSGPTLAQAQSSQIAALRTACANAITGGFSSSALGSLYNYPSDPLSQSNMNTVAGSSSGGSLWCESGGVWTFKAHTQAQAQAVLAAFVAWLNSCQSQLATLTAEVNAATTVSAVQAVVWVNP